MVQNKIMAIKVDDDTKSKIEEYAKQTFRSKSGVIKYAITKLIAEDKNG